MMPPFETSLQNKIRHRVQCLFSMVLNIVSNHFLSTNRPFFRSVAALDVLFLPPHIRDQMSASAASSSAPATPSAPGVAAAAAAASSSSSGVMNREQLADTIPDSVRIEVMNLVSMNRNNPEVITAFFDTIVTQSMPESQVTKFKALCFALYDSSVPLPLARFVFRHLVQHMLALDDEQFMELATIFMIVHQLPNNNSRSFALEFTLVILRRRMSIIYESRNEYFRAADVLSRIPNEALTEMADNGFSTNVRIAHLFIQAGLVDRAGIYLSRATTHMNSCTDESVKLQHSICQAHILDLKRRFEDAAHRYYMLANDTQAAQQQQQQTIDGDSTMSDNNVTNSYNANNSQVPSALVHAVTCAILAPAGPRRSRLLAMLYNDERSKRLDLFPLLESIHMGRLLQKDQVDRLRPTLQPHQLEPHPDGDTVLDHAVIEHNMLAISRMYANIGLNQLAVLLNVTAEKAEKTARVMINEKRMNASIDQVEHMVQFSNQSPTARIKHWDALIASLCGQVDDCVDAIVQKFPSFATHI